MFERSLFRIPIIYGIYFHTELAWSPKDLFTDSFASFWRTNHTDSATALIWIRDWKWRLSLQHYLLLFFFFVLEAVSVRFIHTGSKRFVLWDLTCSWRKQLVPQKLLEQSDPNSLLNCLQKIIFRKYTDFSLALWEFVEFWEFVLILSNH